VQSRPSEGHAEQKFRDATFALPPNPQFLRCK
jgi:hypothetical protein